MAAGNYSLYIIHYTLKFLLYFCFAFIGFMTVGNRWTRHNLYFSITTDNLTNTNAL